MVPFPARLSRICQERKNVKLHIKFRHATCNFFFTLKTLHYLCRNRAFNIKLGKFAGPRPRKPVSHPGSKPEPRTHEPNPPSSAGSGAPVPKPSPRSDVDLMLIASAACFRRDLEDLSPRQKFPSPVLHFCLRSSRSVFVCLPLCSARLLMHEHNTTEQQKGKFNVKHIKNPWNATCN